ncbi:MAG: CDP-diacylglycerol--glycerol-3-phosphate 3-phosphatidyltransferase [Gemmataceae bacterium]
MPTTTTRDSPATVFNLPNHLTTSRFFLALVLFALIAWEKWLPALVVFAVAGFTDWLDGYLARVQNLTSSLGRMLDPLVDKVLTCGAFIFLLPYGHGPEDHWLTPWMVTLVVAREFLITGLRSYLESLGARFGADWLGKAKMVLQCAAIVAILVSLYDQKQTWALSLIRDLLIYAMLAATLFSGLQYLWRGLAILRADPVKANL